MNAVVIAIGTELTGGHVQDTNSPWISRELDLRGVRTTLGMTVPDSRPGIASALNHALGLAPDLIVVTGGLGPTSDDLTAAAIAEALDLDLALDPVAEMMVAGAVGLDDLEPHQEKQARLPAGSISLMPAGTAPGFILHARSIPIVVLPGVPREMKEMWDTALEVPLLQAVLAHAEPKVYRTACFYSSGEPAVSEAVDTLFKDILADLEVSICTRRQEVRLEIAFPAEFAVRVEELLVDLRQELGETFYSDGEEIESVIAGELAYRGKTLAVGESCTGGMLGEAITSVPGSSVFFLGGVTAYHNEVKKSLLKVRQEVLDKAGAVSEPVAQQLALGVRASMGADFGIGITGVAGPDGGTPEKPVGLVFICVSSAEGDVVERFDFPGDREDIRQAAVTAALHMLHRKILFDRT